MAYAEFLWIIKKSRGRKIYFEMVYSAVCARKKKKKIFLEKLLLINIRSQFLALS